MEVLRFTIATLIPEMVSTAETQEDLDSLRAQLEAFFIAAAMFTRELFPPQYACERPGHA
jgi:hypothetical protein